MTTVLYKPECFVACDSKWTIEGNEIEGVKEDKFILHHSPNTNEMYISFMCGSHIAIALNQALFIELINPEEYFGLSIRYLDFFPMEYDVATFKLTNGELKTRPHEYYPENKINGAFSLGTGGRFAGAFYYHSTKQSHKKRRKNPPFYLSEKCKISCALQFAYSQDRHSGGRVNKIEWSDGQCVGSSILPVDADYIDNYRKILVHTIKEVHEMYEKNFEVQALASASKAHPTLNSQPSPVAGTAKASTRSGAQASQMTMSRVLEQIKMFKSL
ncbi:hypothetical protein NL402_11385 [Serratia marcescens]|uniref:hypothetical protein n=1 Tax=Serratia marcescens TaxID=615 RepID=UPI0025A44335|nr:hypothetical protein [Serratia marcescens]MDM8341397.1 hypothetical protein [Serratia marcescens]